jgi:N-ethylmaleimide reductase
MTTPTATVSLFAPYRLGALTLQNRVVMAPMTRSRAIGNVANDLIATYYAQRASAGLIVTEGISPSPNGLGYARIPGLFTAEQAASWKPVTDAVHAQGGRIFVQLMHTGRTSHPANMAEGTRILAPSAIAQGGEMWTDTAGMQPHPVPTEMTGADIEATIAEYVQSAKLAIEAGFDGIELHGANGYLIEQFLNPASNQRTDAYGGSNEKRLKFALDVAAATVAAIGGERVGIRLSPYGVNGGLGAFEGIDDTYESQAAQLSGLGLAYIHVVDHSAMGAPEVPATLKARMRQAFKGTFILAGGYDRAKAEADLEAGKADLIAFGKPFISNPRLVGKLQAGAELRAFDPSTFFTPGEAGYIDYPLD